MTKFKVYEVEDRATPNGKKLKKLVLQGEGKQYPDKNVTMWENHSLFNSVKAGDTIEGTLDVKESTTPNPHGGYYKNKTLLEGNSGSGGDINAKLDKIISLLENRQNQPNFASEEDLIPDDDMPPF